jgi:hypothetical protein
MRALLQWCVAHDRLQDPRLTAATETMLGCFARDAGRYSDVLELSLSVDAGGIHRCRWSYALPGFRDDVLAGERVLRALLRPFGDRALDAGARVLRAACHTSVEQPLFGLAHDGAAGLRLKLYLQFRDGRHAGACHIARSLTGCRVDPARLGPSLHMLGLDLGDSGMRGAKLYFRGPALDGELAGLPNFLIQDPLYIHRMSAPDDPALARAAEVDFALAPSGEVLTAALARHLEALAAVDELAAAFPLRARRLSLSLGGPRKLTLYYVPSDVPTGAKPPGGG